MTIRLSNPWFEAYFFGRIAVNGKSYIHLDSIEGAQGINFWCPCGFGKAEYPIDGARPHEVQVVFANPRNAPLPPSNFGPCSKNDPNIHPRWTMTGTGLSDLTLTPSVDVGKPTCWHGFVTSGEIR